MATQESNVDLVKKADRVADVSFWLFLAMVGTALAALIFKVNFEIVQAIFSALVLASFGIRILETKLLRRALKSEGAPRAES